MDSLVLNSEKMPVEQEVLKLLKSYIPIDSQSFLLVLPIVRSQAPILPELVLIELPLWARDICPHNHKGVYVPKHCLINGNEDDWLRVDWYRAVFDMVTCQYEREREEQEGPLHSYAVKLPAELAPMFSHAWVNRIGMFLRRWAAVEAGIEEDVMFGPRPKGQVYLTHDVDYVQKTPALRVKQGAFNVFNAVRSALKLDFKGSVHSIIKGGRFFFGGGDYWQFDKIAALESKYGVTSYWNFYGGYHSVKHKLKPLLDPAYDVADERLSRQLRWLYENNHVIGLHQSFFSWKATEPMRSEKTYLESALGISCVESCRQHWLKFNFKDTWSSQEQLGIRLDMTLGFNDSSGFRNAAALRIPYWDGQKEVFSENLEIVPMVLMDSHLFDYQVLIEEDRRNRIDSILNEIKQTGGVASIIWHQRVFHADYGWGDDYEYLLKRATAMGLL